MADLCLSPTTPTSSSTFENKSIGFISVTNPLGKKLDISITNTETLESIKAQIDKQFSLEPDSYSLVHLGNELTSSNSNSNSSSNSTSLSSLGIYPGSSLSLTPKLVSGRQTAAHLEPVRKGVIKAEDLVQALSTLGKDEALDLNVAVGDQVYSLRLGLNKSPQMPATNSETNSNDINSSSKKQAIVDEDELERERRKAFAQWVDQKKEEQLIAKRKEAENKKLASKIEQVKANLKKKKLGKKALASTNTTATNNSNNNSSFGGLKKGFFNTSSSSTTNPSTTTTTTANTTNTNNQKTTSNNFGGLKKGFLL